MVHTLPVAGCLVDVVFPRTNRRGELQTISKFRLLRRQVLWTERALGRLPEALYHLPLVLDIVFRYIAHLAIAQIRGRGQSGRE